MQNISLPFEELVYLQEIPLELYNQSIRQNANILVRPPFDHPWIEAPLFQIDLLNF